MHEFLVSTVAFIVLIGLMVVVHEFGHFAVAKLCGVRVEAFSVGFGPRLFGIKYGETDYKVCLLPLGGFVKMTGEGPGEDQQLDDPGAFTAHPRWQRMLIGVAGPMANFVLAFVLMLLYFGMINEVPNVRPSVLEWVTPSSAAAQAGMKPGDVITQFGTARNPDLETLLDTAKSDAGKTIPVTVDRGGKSVLLQLALPAKAGDRGGMNLPDTGMYLHYVNGPIGVDQVSGGTPADKAGMQAGDQIVAVDGHEFHTLDPLVEYLQDGKGQPVTLTVKRKDAVLPPIVVHPMDQAGHWRLGFLGMAPAFPPVERRPMSLGDAMTASKEFCADNSLMIVDVLEKLLTRQASVKQLSGPVGIAQVAGQAAQTKYWSPKFAVAAGISLNLGILNMLPFPILDGGMILFLLIESAMRHDIGIQIKERIYQAAFVLIVMFFVYVSFNDVSKLSIFSHLKP
ncbi:MAG TPA: RIP metalloprotease RseP [Terracidiphilus sp.]|nr:RIP metalloprotease RseP [Terracidiphilus sp.]